MRISEVSLYMLLVLISVLYKRCRGWECTVKQQGTDKKKFMLSEQNYSDKTNFFVNRSTRASRGWEDIFCFHVIPNLAILC